MATTTDAVVAATVGLLSAGGGGVVAQVITAWRRRGRDQADKDGVIVGAAHDVVKLLRDELIAQDERHREEMARMREELTTAQTQITELRRALAAAGGAA